MLKAKAKDLEQGSGVGRLHRQPLLLALVMMCVAGFGCHKNAASASNVGEAASATNAAEQELANGPVAPPEPPQPPLREVLARADDKAHQGVVGEVDPFLTRQLRIFVQQKNRMPASFSEFARARLDSVPRPPAGKKWAIDAQSLEVKAVTQ